MKTKQTDTVDPAMRERNYESRWIALGVFLLASAAFFFVPMAFAPDSGGYLSGALGLLDGAGIGSFARYRGPVLPVLLAGFCGLFGRTVFAVKLCWFGFYALMYFSLYQLLKTLGMFQKRSGWLIWILFLFAFMLNPCVMAYGHLCLTELPVLSCLSVCTWRMAILYKNEKDKTTGSLFLKKLLLLSIFTVLVYAIKQAAFPIVLTLFGICELLSAIQKRCPKQLLKTLAAVCCSLLCLFGYIRLWNAVLPSGSVEGDSISGFAGSFLVDGLRYFRVTERGEYGKPVTVEVMSDDYESVEKTFEYTFEGTLQDSLAYWLHCVQTSPQKVMRGYAQNYLLVTGTRHLLGAAGAERAYAKVNATTEFFTGQETAAWTDAFAQLSENEEGSMRLTNDGLTGNTIDVESYNNSIPRKLLFNSYYRKLAYFQYSFTTYHALLIGVFSIIGVFVCKKHGWNSAVHKINFVCAAVLFVQISFLAVTAQGIDRYGFPLVLFSFLIVVNTAVACMEWASQKVYFSIKNKSA